MHTNLKGRKIERKRNYFTIVKPSFAFPVFRLGLFHRKLFYSKYIINIHKRKETLFQIAKSDALI